MINLVLCCAMIFPVQGAPAGQSARPIGAILKLDAAAHSITIKSDAGPEMAIAFDESTRFLRVDPALRISRMRRRSPFRISPSGTASWRVARTPARQVFLRPPALL